MKNRIEIRLQLVLVIVMVSITLLSCDSYERKMAKLEKVATEFKATLGPNNQVIAEQIDSVAQKVFYLDKDGDGNLSHIKVHDYSTNETKSILPESGKIEDFEFCNSEFKGSKLIKDRLFLKIQSPYCMWELGSTGVFFVNVRDNTLHYVESCNDATFLENGEIAIKKFYYLGFDEEYGEEETDINHYSLSTSLSDEAYANNRREQKRTEERLAEDWKRREEEKRLAEERRRQGVERIIKFDYTLNRPGYEDYAGSLRGVSLHRDGVYSKTIIIPNGKVWQLKSISYSGYSESNPPRFCYCKNVNGAFDIGREELKNGQILYPWGYTFWIMFDENRSDRGRRTAEIVFMEKEY